MLFFLELLHQLMVLIEKGFANAITGLELLLNPS
jgi:hypothetical protein